MAAFFNLFLCFLCIGFVNCQFGLFPQRERNNNPRGFLGNIAGSIGNILRPNHRRPISNQNNNQDNQNYNQGNQYQGDQNEYPRQRDPSRVNFVDNNPPSNNENGGNNQGNVNFVDNPPSAPNNNDRPIFVDNNPPNNDNPFFVDNNKPNNNDRPLFVDNNPPNNNDNPFFVDNNPPRPSGETDRPIFVDNNPPEPNPEFNNDKPIFVDNNPPTPNDQTDGPIFVENKPPKPNDQTDGPIFINNGNGQPEETTQAVTPNAENRNQFAFVTEPTFKATCTSVNGQKGQCVNLARQCPKLYELAVSQQSNPEVVNTLRTLHCGFDGSEPKVCCPLNDFSTKAPATLPPAPDNVTPVTQPRTVTEAPVSGSDYVDALPNPPECGVSNLTLPRVVGGMPAKLGAFPWMALLGYRRGRDTQWKCGGSLITRRHVLTASHCVHNQLANLYVVRLGELDLSRDDDGASPIDILIKEKVIHEQFDSKIVTNDIAMLTLEKDVQFTALIRPICMPLAPQLRSNDFENYRPLVAGWGALKYKGETATHLQFVQLPVLSVQECHDAYTAKYPDQQIDQRTICAGYKQGKKDACSGDSGGPLMQPERDTGTGKTYVYQTGVVSYGRGCALPGFPGVYTRVTEFLPWIIEKVTGKKA